MKQIFLRLNSETPVFFTKLGNIFLGIGALSAVVLSAGAILPASVVAIAGYGLTISAVGKIVSKLTTVESAVEAVGPIVVAIEPIVKAIKK